MIQIRSLMLPALLALVMASPVLAQMKAIPPAGTGAEPPLSNSAAALKELAAQATAEKWLGLLDRAEYAKAWDECAQLFRDRVTRQQWVESLPITRAPLGAAKARKVEVAAYKTSMPGAPEGQYVTVRFRSTFENKDNVEELITLVLEDNVWRPTGYVIR